jgi:DNA gyrase subunit B
MPDLIEGGYLYVAQPPLYRVVDGKNEAYVKDEDAFNRYLLRRVGERESVTVRNGDKLSGRRLEDFFRNLLVYYDNLASLGKRGYHEELLELLLSHGLRDKNQLKDRAFVEQLQERLTEAGVRVEDLRQDRDETGFYEFKVTDPAHQGKSMTVNWEVIASPELKRVMTLWEKLKEWTSATFLLGDEGDGKELKEVNNLRDLFHYLEERGKKGLTVQRYKGLGEMNPGQLWETTMDPDKRTLLKVKVEDVVEADEIFSTLMGDKVEPRRDFIQTNALEVTDLDI